MKRLQEFAAHHAKHFWSVALTALVLLLALAGSYQYYSDLRYVDVVVEDRVWSSAAYSALRLYAFSSEIPPGVETPVLYEAAKWLAPLCTAYWLFQLVESFFRRQLLLLRRAFSRRKQLIVFGYHEKSAVFLQNLLAEKRKDRDLTLVADKPLDPDVRLTLERARVLILRMDPGEEGDLPPRVLTCVRRAAELVLFYQEPTMSLSLLTRLLDAASRTETPFRKREESVYCAVWCEDWVTQRIIIDYYDSAPGPRPFDFRVFSMPDIAADALLQSLPLYENCLTWGKKHSEGLPPEALLEHVPMPHVLIVGFGKYGQAVFQRAVLTGILSDRSKVPGYEQLQITVVDRDAVRVRELLESRYPGLYRVCTVHCVEGEAGSLKTIRALAKLPMVTYAVICLSSQSCGIDVMERLESVLAAGDGEDGRLDMDIPIAVRMKSDDAVIRYCRRGGPVHKGTVLTAFGTDRKLLTYDRVVLSDLERSAKLFNAVYDRTANVISGGEETERDPAELWSRLSFEKKDFCRAQAMHAPYFRALLALFPPLPPQNDLLDKAADTDRFLRELAACPALDALSALEHRRWCACCYACGYVGPCEDPKEKGKECWRSGEKDLVFGKVHPCLEEDWALCRRLDRIRRTIAYDVCSIYTFAGTGQPEADAQ